MVENGAASGHYVLQKKRQNFIIVACPYLKRGVGCLTTLSVAHFVQCRVIESAVHNGWERTWKEEILALVKILPGTFVPGETEREK